MSTTDRTAFEQYAESQGCRDFEYDQNDSQRYRNPFTQREYKYWRAALDWQAATEAAKATGTAGELPPLPEPTASTLYGGHLYSLDKMLAFAHAAIHKCWCAEVNCDAVREELAELKAARQPAPVAAQENGGLVRAALIDLMEVEQAATAGEFKQDKTFDFAKQSHYRALFARARAALAATAAPVLTSAKINEIYQRTHKHCYDGAAAGNFLREYIAATRGQP